MTTHIYVDVDGVLNALAKHPWLLNTSWDLGRWRSFYANGFLIKYNEDVIDVLRELEAREDVKMFWLTTWTSDAPALLSPELGIGADWGVVGGAVEQTYGGKSGHLWWKFNALNAHLQNDTPDRVVWIDDDHAHIETKTNEEKVLKIAPISDAGLENYHFDQIKKFLDN